MTALETVVQGARDETARLEVRPGPPAPRASPWLLVLRPVTATRRGAAHFAQNLAEKLLEEHGADAPGLQELYEKIDGMQVPPHQWRRTAGP
jgi:hypothetical protein